ncbi:hypothetical protein [Pseudokineococcus lusitanus]|uniref:Uncharacterized protein n=1 Tax=Pseudokineococcus lusitanus TaxID=763993 RepID=A0A3N1HU98_9ACTN|nr:hypothetical protein [Pseudokineococcus lusitanus]ROP45922.1 hypothetical protein EDC03_0537 [Pseudokineococcus lusitanus]
MPASPEDREQLRQDHPGAAAHLPDRRGGSPVVMTDDCFAGRHQHVGDARGCQGKGCACACHDVAATTEHLQALADELGHDVEGWPLLDLAAHLRDPAPVTGRPQLAEEHVEAVVRLVLDLGWRPARRPDGLRYRTGPIDVDERRTADGGA